MEGSASLLVFVAVLAGKVWSASMRSSGYERAAEDWYVEPRWLVDALLNVEAIPKTSMVWDPSCGGGTIPIAVTSRGVSCRASDIVNRGYGEVSDFFSEKRSADVIISNPPYGVIEKYIQHALGLTKDRVIILARLALLESQSRQVFFNTTPIARIWVSSRRASMPPGGSDIKAKGGTIAFAWFVWDHAHQGKPTLGWI